MERTIPKLSPKGWLHNEDVPERLDAAMAYAFSSDFSQSVTFSEKITSIQWVISEYNNNLVQLQSSMQKLLDEYLAKQFDSVNINVTIKEEGSQLNIVVRGMVINDGSKADMQYLLTVRNSSLETVVDQLNNGEPVDVR